MDTVWGGGAAWLGLNPTLSSHSSKEAAALVNGVQPGKHENGFSGTEGSKELQDLSHHGGSPGSIIPFGDKEPFLKQAVVKPPQVTGEQQEGCEGAALCTPQAHTALPTRRGAVRAWPMFPGATACSLTPAAHADP